MKFRLTIALAALISFSQLGNASTLDEYLDAIKSIQPSYYVGGSYGAGSMTFDPVDGPAGWGYTDTKGNNSPVYGLNAGVRLPFSFHLKKSDVAAFVGAQVDYFTGDFVPGNQSADHSVKTKGPGLWLTGGVELWKGVMLTGKYGRSWFDVKADAPSTPSVVGMFGPPAGGQSGTSADYSHDAKGQRTGYGAAIEVPLAGTWTLVGEYTTWEKLGGVKPSATTVGLRYTF